MSDLSKKIWTQTEVEKILFDTKSEYDKRLREQKERIFSLVNELGELKQENEKLKKRDQTISEALLKAAQKAKEIEEKAKITVDSETLKLKTFVDKCETYCQAVMKKYPPNSEIESLAEIADKVKKIYIEDETQGDSVENTDKINDGYNKDEELSISKDFNPKQKIENYIYNEAKPEKNESGFNMDDVLNPKKELNLEELCKELGLMD